MTRCSHVGCTNNAKKGCVYVRHGAMEKPCSQEGCTTMLEGETFAEDLCKFSRNRPRKIRTYPQTHQGIIGNKLRIQRKNR